MIRLLAALFAGVAMIAAALAQTPGPTEALKDLAPTGTIRASINLGNVVLAQKDEAGQVKGISVDLARELGRRLNAPVQLIPFDAAGKVFEANKGGTLDVMFLAIEPVRAAEIHFTAPYVIIEGSYLVPKESKLMKNEELDQPGIRIGVNRGSAYDLFLTRTLKQAQLQRSADGLEALVTEKLEAAAGVKQALQQFAARRNDVRLIDGRFMEISQAMGTPKGRGEAGAAYLTMFLEEMKRSGFVAEAVKRHNQSVTLAPPAS
jgi:polar amino acid transport system substrate-binding protein